MFRTSRKTALLASLGLAATLGFALPTAPAVAATVTSTFAVTATVQATCLIVAGPLSFGNYATGQTDASSTITVTCTNTSPYNVGLNAGLSTGATVTTRKMTQGAATLAYSLSSDAARAVNWGNTVGTDTVAGTGNGSPQTLTVFGRVPGGQFVAPGAYTDTVTATITF